MSWRPRDEFFREKQATVVYMIIYLAHDGLWHVWDSPLAVHDVQWSAQMCRSSIGDGVPIRWCRAGSIEDLATYVIQLNEDQSILNSQHQNTESVEWTGKSLLPDPRPYWALEPADRRRLDIENGQGGDHNTEEVYVRREADLTKWVRLLARYQRGELES